MAQEPALLEILEAREARARHQDQILKEWSQTLVCLTLNIPGPVKVTPQTRRFFAFAGDLVRGQLKALGPILLEQRLTRCSGHEAYYVTAADPLKVKKAMVSIEEAAPAARLLDLDVLRPGGTKVSREELGLPGRRCLLCDQPAMVCARSRAHGLDQLMEKTNSLLEDALLEMDSRQVSQKAVEALLFEACAGPKPGLVDRFDSGSHRDMDLFTFLTSSATLSPYFADCYKIGYRTKNQLPQETFQALRLPGLMAEVQMTAATNGVNTHKGAIFSLGLLCGALGRLGYEPRPTARDLCSLCAQMTRGLMDREMGVGDTHGQKAYRLTGSGGARQQAQEGFPLVLEVGLPTLRAHLARGETVDQTSGAALLALMCHCQDTNLVARGGADAIEKVAEYAGALLEREPTPTAASLQEMNRWMVQQNLSPGGSADLLALSWFLYNISPEKSEENL